MNLQEDGQTEEKTAILIVDDNEINRMILSETFRDQDKILEAENGKEALDLIRREPGGISAILLDIVMPETVQSRIHSGDTSLVPWILLKSQLFLIL